MSFNGCSSYGGYDDRSNDFGNYQDRSYVRDIDYRRDRQRRGDYDDMESRRDAWYPDRHHSDRPDNIRRKRSWQEFSHRSSRDDYDEQAEFHDDDMCTIFVGGLPTFIAESDIEDNLNSFGLRAKDIRVVKKKDPGSNRGFAFVEFYSASEAQEWMDQTKGVLNFCEGISTTLSVSKSWNERGREEKLPRTCDSPPRKINDTPPTVYKGDWKCVKCGCINFRRRDKCFKCKIERQESDYEITSQDGSDFIGIAPTETLLIRGLSPITDEARIRQVLFYATKIMAKDVFIARNPIDHSSAGFGFLLVSCPNDSLAVLDALRGSGHPLEVDGCPVQINFSKMNFLNVMVMLSHRGFLAKSLSNQEESTIQKEDAEGLDKDILFHGTADKKDFDSKDSNLLASPDTNRYVFDETSGYYYDPSTELYYDAASQYFYDNKKACFLYWDERTRKYVEVPQTSESSQAAGDEQNCYKNQSHSDAYSTDEKNTKAKQAKKIALEMEKWAKQQNAHKEGSFKKPLPVTNAFRKPSAADAGFKVLTKSEKPKIDIKLGKEEKPNVLSKLVASYGDSDSEDETSSSPAKELESLEEKLTDWNKLTCLLCKRVFTSLDILKKHKILSDLHKTNLEKYKEKLTGKVTAA